MRRIGEIPVDVSPVCGVRVEAGGHTDTGQHRQMLAHAVSTKLYHLSVAAHHITTTRLSKNLTKLLICRSLVAR